ncbi:uncharacterized protein [Chironomus tepperi]|uniref:uncharacterized protein n=1 Tax=Chironomus tepperi TaxID=113505 RepID=UPI00391F8DE3
MKKQIFNGCCLCFDLRSGAQILGWLHIIGGVVGVAGSLLVIAVTRYEDIEFFIGEKPVSKTFMVVVMAVVCAVAVTNVFGGTMLIIALKQQSHRKMIIFMALIVINMIAFAVNIAMDVITIISITALVLVWCLYIYFSLVIYSLYIKTKNQNEQVHVPTNYQYPAYA